MHNSLFSPEPRNLNMNLPYPHAIASDRDVVVVRTSVPCLYLKNDEHTA